MTGSSRDRSRSAVGVAVGILLTLGACLAPELARAGIGRTRVDPEQVVPMDQIPAEFREHVADVIRDHTFHRRGDAEAFPCDPSLYLSLVNEPAITLALWKDLADNPVRIKRLGPDSYSGDDGSGSSAAWRFIVRTPKLHVVLADLAYLGGPRGNTRIEARVVLLLRAGYYREVNKQPYIQHDVEAFVKVDSRGWKTLARTFRPVIEKLMDDQVREAGQFISLMTRLVVSYPDWASDVAASAPEATSETRTQFRQLVAEHRLPDASTGRPVVMADASQSADPRRR